MRVIFLFEMNIADKLYLIRGLISCLIRNKHESCDAIKLVISGCTKTNRHFRCSIKLTLIGQFPGSLTDFWKTHPCKFNGYLLSFVQKRVMSSTDFQKIHPKKRIWKSITEIGLTHDRKIQISNKLDEFSRNRHKSPFGALKLLKNIWMSVSGLANMG